MRYLTTTLFIITFAFVAQAQPMLGTYYVGTNETPGGQDPEFSTLYDAVQALYSRGIDGNVQLLITGDLEESNTVFLGIDTDGSTITIKPAPGASPLITFSATAGNDNINGAFVIGAEQDDWLALVPTSNIIIDGSNQEEGTSRDMTFTTTAGAATSNYFRILGSASNVEWRNTNIIMGQESFDALLVSPLRTNGIDYTPTNVTVANNYIVSKQTRTSSRAINVWGVTGDDFEAPQNIDGSLFLLDNEIEARRYGIWLREYTGNTVISGNTIRINEEGTLAAYGILTDNALSDQIEIEISNNAITQLRAGRVIKGMSLVASGKYTLYNNTITGFEVNNTADPVVEFYGIHVETPPQPQVINVSAYHNTILMNPLGQAGDSGWRYRGFQSNSNARISVDFRNNILINADDTEAASFAYYQFGIASTITSDYNTIFVVAPSADNNTWFGRLSGSGGENFDNINDWRSNTTLDVNSSSVAVVFDDESLLTLDREMESVNALKAPRLSAVMRDIAGAQRQDPTFKGAWSTPGSVSIPAISDMAAAISLNQNYPNPFNPTTTLSFTLTETAPVQLSVYTVDGRLISTLLRDVRPAGQHTVSFDASALSSGIYIYQLQSGSSIETRKMTLIK